MKKLKPSQAQTALSLALLLSILPATASAAPRPEIAEVENQGTVLMFYPFVESTAVTLTVSGPCGYHHREVFDRGETPFFKLEEGITIDGAYTFQLRTRPVVDPSIAAALQQARQSFDEELPKQLCREGLMPAAPEVQAAGFTVANFEILFDPSLTDDGVPTTTGKNGELGGIDNGDAGRLGGYFAGDPAAKDFVILDDLIVDGSTCIGFSCVDGEDFGFDTLRLKENNLRITFDDSSIAGNFPNNDWQLTANDTANGGANKFSIDDITHSRTPFTVEAQAPSHSLFVDDGGRIGNQTSTPATELHISNGDSPTIRLNQNGSAGFDPQSWDLGGNETNFFIRDVSSGSRLPFRIRSNAQTDSIVIGESHHVGLGTSFPDFNLHIVEFGGGVATRDLIRLENNGTTRISMLDTSTNDEWQFANNGGANAFVITAEGSGAAELSLNRADNGVNPGRLTITGDIVTGGGVCGGGCDAVFDGEIESIEEHAASMWENSFLPAVGPTGPNEPWNLTEKTSGILNELEKAHIYIEQLNTDRKDKANQIADLKESVVSLQDRLARLEALLSAQAD